jgi:hypothetical protein
MCTRGRFEELLRGIKEKLPEIEWQIADPNRPYRALEKMALEDSDRQWTARCVVDLSRGSIVCSNTKVMQDVFTFLDACTSKARSALRNPYVGLMRHLPEVRFVRVKNRFERPARGGWADIFVNFVFVADQLGHVHELQIQHRSLVCIRTDDGEDSHYAGLRVLDELLQKSCGTAAQETKRP